MILTIFLRCRCKGMLRMNRSPILPLLVLYCFHCLTFSTGALCRRSNVKGRCTQYQRTSNLNTINSKSATDSVSKRNPRYSQEEDQNDFDDDAIPTLLPITLKDTSEDPQTLFEDVNSYTHSKRGSIFQGNVPDRPYDDYDENEDSDDYDNEGNTSTIDDEGLDIGDRDLINDYSENQNRLLETSFTKPDIIPDKKSELESKIQDFDIPKSFPEHADNINTENQSDVEDEDQELLPTPVVLIKQRKQSTDMKQDFDSGILSQDDSSLQQDRVEHQKTTEEPSDRVSASPMNDNRLLINQIMQQPTERSLSWNIRSIVNESDDDTRTQESAKSRSYCDDVTGDESEPVKEECGPEELELKESMGLYSFQSSENANQFPSFQKEQLRSNSVNNSDFMPSRGGDTEFTKDTSAIFTKRSFDDNEVIMDEDTSMTKQRSELCCCWIQCKSKALCRYLMSWDWRPLIKGYQYDVVKRKTYVSFITDGSNKLPLMKRLTYNMARIFSLKENLFYFGFLDNIGNEDVVFRKYKEGETMQEYLKSIQTTPNSVGKIGDILQKLVIAFKSKQPVTKTTKKALFLTVQRKTKGCLYKIRETGKSLKKLGVRVYVLILGMRVNIDDMLLLTVPNRIFRATDFSDLILGNTRRPSIFYRLYRRMETWVSGTIQGWYNLYWNWYEFIPGLSYGGLGRANVGFVVDMTSFRSRYFVRNLAYNYARQFQLRGSKFLFLAYGSRLEIVSGWREYISPQDIQIVLNDMPYIRGGSRRTAQALSAMHKLFVPLMNGDLTPNIIFLITIGQAEDTHCFRMKGEILRELGIKVFAIGVNANFKYFADDLSLLAFSPAYVAYGEKASFVTLQRFEGINSVISQDTGAGSVTRIQIGDNDILDIQKQWNWGSLVEELSYGGLGSANIGILIGGRIPKNADYIRRLVYNLIRIHSLSGSHFTIVVYGSSIYRSCHWTQIRREEDAKKLCEGIPRVKTGKHMTGNALRYMRHMFAVAPPGTQNILYLIVTGKSSDDATQQASKLRNDGIKVVSIGVTGFVKDNAAEKQDVDITEISLIAYSSGLIFAASLNALVPLILDIQSTMKTVVGQVSNVIESGGSFQIEDLDIVNTWDWRTTGYNIMYQVAARTNLILLIDGTNKNHFDVLQRYVYNIGQIFHRSTKISMTTFGGDIDETYSGFHQYQDSTIWQLGCQALRYRGSRRRFLRKGLDYITKIVDQARLTSQNTVVVILLTGKPDESYSDMLESLKNKVNSALIGISNDLNKDDYEGKVGFLSVTKWKKLPRTVGKLHEHVVSVIGKGSEEKETGPQTLPAMSKKVIPSLLPPDVTCSSSSSSKDIYSLTKSWSWKRLHTGITYGDLQEANLVFVIDVSKDERMDIIRRFIYNIIRLFKSVGTSITVITYGKEVALLDQPAKKFSNSRKLKAWLEKIQARAERTARTKTAVQFVYSKILHKLPPNKADLLFIIMQRASWDSFMQPVEQLRGAGVTITCVGIGDINREEVRRASSIGHLAITTTTSLLPASVVRIIHALSFIVNNPTPETTWSQSSTSKLKWDDVIRLTRTSSAPYEFGGSEGQVSTEEKDQASWKSNTDVVSGGGTVVAGSGNTKTTKRKPQKDSGNAKSIKYAGGTGSGVVTQSETSLIESATINPSKADGCLSKIESEPKPFGNLKPDSLGLKLLKDGGMFLTQTTGLNKAGGYISQQTQKDGGLLGSIYSISPLQSDLSSSQVQGGFQELRVEEEALEILKGSWNWERHLASFTYDVVAASQILFIIDSGEQEGFDILKRFTYNVARMFHIPESIITVITFGRSTTMEVQEQTFVRAKALKKVISGIQPDIGEGSMHDSMEKANQILKNGKGKKKVLFLVTREELKDDISKLELSFQLLGNLQTIIHTVLIDEQGGGGRILQLAEKEDRSHSHSTTRNDLPLLLTTLQSSLLIEIGPHNKIGHHLAQQMLLDNSVIPKTCEDKDAVKAIKSKGILLKWRINAFAACQQDVDYLMPYGGSIYLNGYDWSPKGAGINIVVINFSTLKIIDVQSFDTTARFSESDRLVLYIERLEINKLIFLSTRGDFASKMKWKAWAALLSIGARDPFLTAPCSSFAMIGFKGADRATWVTQVQTSKEQGAATLHGQLMVKKVKIDSCEDKDEESVVLCEDQKATIKCPEDSKIVINYAVYGRSRLDICPIGKLQSTKCRSVNSYLVTQNLCLGKRVCEVTASKDAFGDPCPATSKYLDMRYSCKKVSAQASDGEIDINISLLGAIQVDIIAESCEDRPRFLSGDCNLKRASIKVNGVEMSPNLLGLNIVGLDYLGNVIRTGQKVEDFPDNTVILMATKGTWITSRAALKNLNIGDYQQLNEVKGATAVVGFKGLGTHTWTQVVTRPAGDGPAIISTLISLPVKVKDANMCNCNCNKRDESSENDERKDIDVIISASGCGKRKLCGNVKSSILVNGKEQSPNNYGINLVAYQFCDIKKLKPFSVDTSKDKMGSIKIRKWIKSLPQETLILMASRGKYGRYFNKVADNTMATVGSIGSLNGGSNGAVAFIGYKGKSKPSFISQDVKTSSSSGPAKITTTIGQSDLNRLRRSMLDNNGTSDLDIGSSLLDTSTNHGQDDNIFNSDDLFDTKEETSMTEITVNRNEDPENSWETNQRTDDTVANTQTSTLDNQEIGGTLEEDPCTRFDPQQISSTLKNVCTFCSNHERDLRSYEQCSVNQDTCSDDAYNCYTSDDDH